MIAGGERVPLPLVSVLALVLFLVPDSRARSDDPIVLFETSFEDLSPGPLSNARSEGLVLTAAPGHAEVHVEHHRSGALCLRLLGGTDRSLELDLGERALPATVLDFWAERWTARAPFTFRILGEVDGTWQELFDGDRAITVGGFDTHVRAQLPSRTRRLRFTSTSPESSGLLLDDLRLVRATKMRIVSVDTEQPVTPILLGNRTNPVARVVMKTEGSLEPIHLEELVVDLEGTTALSDLAAVELYATGERHDFGYDLPDEIFAADERFGARQAPAKTLRFVGDRALVEGSNHFWISVELAADANLDHRVDAGCRGLRVSSSADPLVPATVRPEGSQRLGVALRTAHQDGVRAYRIPGLVRTDRGTLIAVYDARHRGWADLPADIDVGMSRSTDGGRTWEPMRIVLDLGHEEAHSFDGVGDPSILFDPATHTLFVAALWSHGERSWHGSGPGLAPDETGQLVLTRSEDDGLTWSAPLAITEPVKDPAWCLLFQGPGKGIVTTDGTLVFPAQFRDSRENGRVPRSTLLASRDHGRTWQVGTGVLDDTTESQVVELEAGTLMQNCRYDRASLRVVRTTTDLGKTWTDHPSTLSALHEPRACMASLIGVERELGKPYRGLLLFSNPDSDSVRERMTIRVSFDGGLTWPADRRLLLDQGKSAGYSCLAMIDEDTVGILYEGSRAHLTFQRIPLREVLDGR